MSDINLLPQELKPNKSVLVLANKIKKASIILASLFFLGTIVVIGLNYYLTSNLEKTNQEIEILRSEIRSLESTEQRLVLVKDRIEKIVKIAARGSTYEEIEVAKNLLSVKSEDIVLNSFYADRDVLKTSFSSPSLATVGSYVEKMVAFAGINRVMLVSFDFNPLVGYTLVINIFV